MSETVETATHVDRYAIDARGSRVTIRAFASGLLSAMGHNPVIAARDVSGEIRLVPGTLEVKELRLSIATASLSVQNDVSDKDRREIERIMREEVLETDRYPAIVFEGSKVTVAPQSTGPVRAEVDGNLTVHGSTRPHRVPVQVFFMGDTLRAQGEFEIRQTDFGIKLVSVAGGVLKIKDELQCSFDLVARKAS
jgi:polyisoprenoid-binding protein YceI